MSELKVLDEYAAFVDVGSESMHASIAGGSPKVFGAMTKDLHALRDWFLSQGVHSVAMEATGVYWLPLYGVLEAAKLQVVMVDGRQTRNVAGRKSDMQDCQWGATLHMHGLLRPGFVPPDAIRRLQNFLRLRADHISMAAAHVQHMHKALEQMNIKIHDQISDITGSSGLAMLRAIIAGERDPGRLLALCDIQIRRSKADRVKESLRGTWTREHLFALKQAMQSWDHYQSQISECDQEIDALLHEMGTDRDDPPPPLRGQRKRPGTNAPAIPDLRQLLVHLCNGNDATILPAHSEYSVLQLIGEVGTDLSKWATEKHFTAWAGLAPASKQSGKRRRTVKRRRNRAGRLFCVMARSLARSNTIALGGFYRRMHARKGGLHANVALARKLAVLFWRVMVKGVQYVERGLADYEEKLQKTKERALNRLAKELGRELVSVAMP